MTVQMVASTSATASKEKGPKEDGEKVEQKSPDPNINFKAGDVPDKLKNVIVDAYMKHRSEPTLPRIVEAMKKELDDAEPKGWVVFAGKHLVGVCTFIKQTMMEFEVDGTAFVIFKTYHP